MAAEKSGGGLIDQPREEASRFCTIGCEQAFLGVVMAFSRWEQNVVLGKESQRDEVHAAKTQFTKTVRGANAAEQGEVKAA